MLRQDRRELASRHFRNSKRCQALLRFATGSVLEGQPDDLREKIIGTMVFGRDVFYETAHDAVVHNVATEVRRRLAQYYPEDGHERELRIEFPSGSDLPVFTPHREHLAPGPSPWRCPRRSARNRLHSRTQENQARSMNIDYLPRARQALKDAPPDVRKAFFSASRRSYRLRHLYGTCGVRRENPEDFSFEWWARQDSNL